MDHFVYFLGSIVFSRAFAVAIRVFIAFLPYLLDEKGSIYALGASIALLVYFASGQFIEYSEKKAKATGTEIFEQRSIKILAIVGMTSFVISGVAQAYYY